MKQSLIWNFEFAPEKKTVRKELFMEQIKEPFKWEIRFFWPDSERITLYPIDDSLLHLTQYKKKQREDYYYLLPGDDRNIKKRRNELLYKPLVKQSGQALAFGAKINIDALDSKEHISPKAVEVYVNKEAFIYKFPTKPKIKLELARLKVGDRIYFSACIEGRSLTLVKNIAEHLLDKQVSCDYVHFLKNIVPL